MDRNNARSLAIIVRLTLKEPHEDGNHQIPDVTKTDFFPSFYKKWRPLSNNPLFQKCENRAEKETKTACFPFFSVCEWAL